MTVAGGIPGLFTGVRTYRWAPLADRVRFTMREDYSGPLAGLSGTSLPDLGPSFQRFADGLTQRAEHVG